MTIEAVRLSAGTTAARPRAWVRALVVLAVLSLQLVLLPDLGHAAPRPPRHEDTAGVLIRSVNAERARAGLKPLRYDHALADQAHEWSVRMARKGRMHHGSPSLPSGATALKENVGYSHRKKAGSHLHSMLMNSKRHRAAILDPHMTRFGVGVVEHDGRVWATQRFANGPVR